MLVLGKGNLMAIRLFEPYQAHILDADPPSMLRQEVNVERLMESTMVCLQVFLMKKLLVPVDGDKEGASLGKTDDVILIVSSFVVIVHLKI
jgi:hypothetical protein